MVWISLLAGPLATAVGPLKPGDHTRTLEVDGRERTYLVRVPASYDGARSFPVVLAFRDEGVRAESMVRFASLNQRADEVGFVAVYRIFRPTT